MTQSPITYIVEPMQGGHRYFVTMRFRYSGGKLVFAIPTWIPGSYTRRDFSKHISKLSLYSVDGNSFALSMLNLSRWQVHLPAKTQDYELTYEVYARDKSVRGCYLDHERGIFNPCCACLYIEQEIQRVHILEFNLQQKHQHWEVSGAQVVVQKNGPYLFDDYHHLIDTPFILAEHFLVRRFDVAGIEHEIVMSGQAQPFDVARLTEDVRKVCAQAVAMFEGAMPKAVGEYRFLLHLTENDYGGLEHRSSTLLMAPRRTLPALNTPQTRDYVQLLGLFSHEYFHTWNVKDLIPIDYQPYVLSQEQPTEMLWLFEGFTAFFDNWLLLQSGVISMQTYLQLLEKDISAYWQRRGRLQQTLALSSYEAWTKLYNGGEDAVNSSTNYYVHGVLMAFCLDIFLRTHSHDELSLADIMLILWQQFVEDGIGLDEASFRRRVIEWLPEESIDDFQQFLTQVLHTHHALPLHWACTQLGLDLQQMAAHHPHLSLSEGNSQQRSTSDAGFSWRQDGAILKVSQLEARSSAALSGVAVEDEIVAVNGFKASQVMLFDVLKAGAVGAQVRLHVFRDGVLHEFEFELNAPSQTLAHIQIKDDASLKCVQRRARWFNLSAE